MNIQFAAPQLLFLLALIPLLLLRHYWLLRRRGPATMRYAALDLTHDLPRSWRATLRPLTILLRMIAITLIIVALARPQAVEGEQIVTAQGIDITLALDISGSMSARLDLAKAAISDFIAARNYDRIGMVVFAHRAFVLTPMTLDRNFVIKQLDQVDLAPNLGLEDGTAIGEALAHAANLLNKSEAKSKVVILLTDGINNAGAIEPLKAAEVAKALGIRVYTIFAGVSGEYRVNVTDESGESQIVVMNSAEDERKLREVAELTGGRYFLMEDAASLPAIYDEINKLEKTEIEVEVFSLFNELAGWLLVPAILIMLLELVLRYTVFRKVP